MLIGTLASIHGRGDVLGFAAGTWEEAFLGSVFSFHLNDPGMDGRTFFVVEDGSPERASIDGFRHGVAEPGDSGEWFVVSRESLGRAAAVCPIPGKDFMADGRRRPYPESERTDKFRRKIGKIELKGREGHPGLNESLAFAFLDLPAVLENFGVDIGKSGNVLLGFVFKGVLDDVGRMNTWRKSGGGTAEYREILADARDCVDVGTETLSLFRNRKRTNPLQFLGRTA